MKWQEYVSKLTKEAYALGYSEEQIQSYLNYGEKLFKLKLPIIYDQIHFSLLVGYKYEYLLGVSNSPKQYYKNFYIPKKNGGERLISEPLTSLKEIQLWILREILNKCKVSPNAKAYILGKSIKDNAKFHRNQHKVLTIDIENFFPSINSNSIIGVFRKLGYSTAVSTLIAKLCCMDSGLPQGAPTSPAISNLVMTHFDNRIFGYCKKRLIRYTRYADDMTFSGNFNEGELLSFVNNVIKSEKMYLNEKKTRLRKRHQQQEVTGVVVNKKLQVPREYRKKLRQEMYYIKKFGLENHLKFIKETNPERYLLVLIGKANFILQINNNDQEVREYLKILHIQ